MKKIIYWSPHINPQIATVKAVLNSALSLSKYERDIEINIINVFGEWDKFQQVCINNNINLIKLFNFNVNLPINGFFQSRSFYIFISLLCIFKLPFIIHKTKPDYFIAHLIVMPVLFVSRFFKSNTKFILRISGLPKLNLFRKSLWKLLSKNLYSITCPTSYTCQQISKFKIIDPKKIFLLEDPILNVTQLPKKRFENVSFKKGYILSVGRLTYQKNFEFLINNFSKIHKKIKKDLIIIGSGENKLKLEKLIKKNGANNFIKILDYQENIDKFYKHASCFILSSRWEDPGFVLIEAAINNLPILSSDCPNGPKEFIESENNGYSYPSENGEIFQKKLIELFNDIDSRKVLKKKISAKRFARKFTIFSHYLKLKNILI